MRRCAGSLTPFPYSLLDRVNRRFTLRRIPGFQGWDRKTELIMKLKKFWRCALGFVGAYLTCAAPTALGAEPNAAGEIDRGPFYSGTIKASFPGNNTTMKGIVVTLGADKNGYVCYDTDLLRLSIGWTGEYLEFGNGQVRIEHPQPPAVKGRPVFGTQPRPGWGRDGGEFRDPRVQQQGPLPKSWAHYRGLYLNGDNVILSYTVGECAVLEMPGLVAGTGGPVFTRSFTVGKSAAPLTLLVCEMEKGSGGVGPAGSAVGAATTGPASQNLAVLEANNSFTAVAVEGAPPGSTWEVVEGKILLKLPPLKKIVSFKLLLRGGASGELAKVADDFKPSAKATDLAALTKGGPARWTTPVVTKGSVGTGSGPYVVDTLTEPVRNPWNAKTFFGGFDFFPDGRAAICTFHGDVWIVSGLDDTLEKLTWKRYATGMFQPLGLRIVDGAIYVTCRDQINRLQDLNHDGEADFYENFNHDTVVTPNYHEFCLDLHTDSKGNFYYAKGCPWPPTAESPHQGTMLKVSKDGARLEVIATGLRAPNGMTIGPDDQITVSDNQGHWMPSSKLNLVKPGGYYGMAPTAQRTPVPTDYDQPICWLPMSMDNSSGGQVFVTSDKWGPFKNHLLFTSYGKGTLFHVMTEQVDGQTQAGMVQFPLRFGSGTMRARFHPRDGQLYVSGLRGWQTSGVKDGSFQRVRYTGGAVNLPSQLHIAKNGIQISFTGALDPASATDLQNYSLEQWNYKYGGDYGSPEFSVEKPGEQHHDQVAVQAARLSADKKTVFLEIAGLRPVMQMKIKFALTAADGASVAQEIYNTIHRLGGVLNASSP